MGEIVALVSGLCFAGANVTIMRGAPRGSADNGAFLSILVTTALSAVAMSLFRPPGGTHVANAAGVAWFALSGLLTMFVGRVFVYASVQHLGAVRAAAIKRLIPVFSVVLGVMFLGERLDVPMTLGMALIFGSFGLLAAESWRTRAPAGEGDRVLARVMNAGYVYGPVSALAYATGYLARKAGLLAMPDPNFGTFIGALTGAVVFVLTGLFVRSYREAVRSTFTRINPWLVGASVLSSLGQLLQFVALNYSTISRVALITSMEVVFTLMISSWILRTGERLGRGTLFAAGMSVAGTALLIGG